MLERLAASSSCVGEGLRCPSVVDHVVSLLSSPQAVSTLDGSAQFY